MIVVDDDVDVFDLNDVMWAVATRVRAEKDIFFIPGAKAAILDPTSDPETFTLTKMGIDATRPLGTRLRRAAGRYRTPSAPRRAPCSKPRGCGCEVHNPGSGIVITEFSLDGFVLPKPEPPAPPDSTQDLSELLMLLEQEQRHLARRG